ncbi:hypothetical protein VTL71DRAFT_12911 [Oculimacula yallundae]|uniref:N-acetyltransferase domain-containing protein n=1 Tax=Oculimacula yallundae TaxID=86028 RepID=A0ABR4CQM0_9HELO
MSSSPSLPITIAPARSPTDTYLISALENKVFYDDPFSIVAFGPERGSSANIEERARGLERMSGGRSESQEEKEWGVIEKATLSGGEREEGEVVGAAAWRFVVGREGENEGSGRDGDVVKGSGESLEDKKEDGGVEKGEKKHSWGIGANVKFCEDVFLVADEHMICSTKGRDYAKLFTLIVSPSHQRRGIGTQLLESGLREVDKLGLQCVLAASKEGVGLYERFGFVETHRMSLRLWEYEGGEGLGEEMHVVMRRPAKSLEN